MEKVSQTAAWRPGKRPALPFYLGQLGEKLMLGSLVVVLKNFIKCSLDNYILPGTLTGIEILWLYIVQWKRDLTLLTSASLILLLSQYDMTGLQRVLSQYRNSSRQTD